MRERYQHLLLEDPKFDIPSKIDILVSGDLFPYIMRSHTEILRYSGYPSDFDTILGWIIVGSIKRSCNILMTTLSVTSSTAIETLLSQFWSVEEPVVPLNHTTEDELCEEWFSKTVSRDKT